MKTREQKRAETAAAIARLREMPSEKLSKAAKWLLKEETREFWYDKKAVMK